MKALTRTYKFQEDSNEERNLDHTSTRDIENQELDDMDSVYSIVLYNNEGKLITNILFYFYIFSL